MLRFLIRSAAALPLLAAMLPAAAQTPDPAYYIYLSLIHISEPTRP